MAQPGRPRKFDQTKRAEVCALLAAGVSVREAARFIGCDPATIRNEARRNHQFRRDLRRSRSQTQVHPLRTMQQAAATNWRAAAWWLERLAPDTFARGATAALGQREANKFAVDLIEIIERVVSNPLEREHLHELLTAALPTAMRRTWDQRQSRRKLQRAMDFFDGKQTEAADGDLLNRSPTPGPRPERLGQHVRATLSSRLRQLVEGKKWPPPTVGAKSATAENSPASEGFFAPPENKDASSSPPQVKTRP